jgi:hypothetical protein
MKGLLFALTVAAVLQRPEEPYPGQSQHGQPPEGWFCEHQNYALSVPASHACSCERSCDENGAVVEDKKCTTWCWPKSCKCDMSNTKACK